MDKRTEFLFLFRPDGHQRVRGGLRRGFGVARRRRLPDERSIPQQPRHGHGVPPDEPVPNLPIAGPDRCGQPLRLLSPHSRCDALRWRSDCHTISDIQEVAA
jgi:hypothetical protein